MRKYYRIMVLKNTYVLDKDSNKIRINYIEAYSTVRYEKLEYAEAAIRSLLENNSKKRYCVMPFYSLK